MINICIVDDHPIFRQGLIAILDQDERMQVIGECATAGEAIDFVAKKKPDFIFIDISLQGMNGIELSKYLHQNHPGLKICILSMHDESVYADRAIRAGARGYIMKQEAGKKVRDAVVEISRGKYFLSESQKDRLLTLLLNPAGYDDGEDSVHSLSNREFEVFLCIGRGMGNVEIGDELNISPKTIETYKRNIRQKLELQDSSDLRKFAVQWRHDKL